MELLARSLLAAGLSLGPVLAVLIALRRKNHAWRAKSRVPFEELRRRPAGESLRVKLMALDERINERIALLVIGPVAAGTGAYFNHAPGWAFPVTVLVFGLMWSGILGWRLYRLLRERANYQLGYDGERFVGEELNRLATLGFEVYHDLPFDCFNMDHVLVGRQGVFLVETKTRRKPLKASGEKEYRVEFDGRRLHWPMGKDEYGVQQAINNSRTLGKWLTGAVGEAVSATPILTLPGWMVDRKAPGQGVHVLNPREIIKLCDNKQDNLSPNLVKRICYQLEEKCKLTFG